MDRKLYMVQTARLLKLYTDVGDYEKAFFTLITALQNFDDDDYKPLCQQYIDASSNRLDVKYEKN